MYALQATERGNGKNAQAWANGHAEIVPEMMQEILAHRAAKLAEVPEEVESGEQVNLLLIRLGREVYGLSAQHVDRVQPADAVGITRVPRVPEWVAGVTNLRGRLLSVVDLVRLFGLPNGLEDTTGQRVLVVVSVAEMEVALLANDVLTVETVPTSRLQETTGTVRGLRPEYVRGVTTRKRPLTGTRGANETIVTVLDLPALLADERLIVHQEVV